MSDQPLDLRRSLHLLWRHKFVVAIFVVLGLAAGIGLTLLRPVTLTSTALVVLPQNVHNVATQVVIASSDPVLIGAQRTLGSGGPPQTLRNALKVKSLTSDIISITAQDKVAARAERTADAVANSYVAYVNSPSRPGPRVQARLLQPALNATATPLPKRLLVTGALGILLGLIIGAIVALAIGRKDRHLKERDEIADSIGIPVLASISVGRPSDAAGWVKLLEDYQPGAVDAWRLRKTLRYLELTDVDRAGLRAGRGISLAVLSLSSDMKALALGPQLAVFAASVGIPTTLVIGPQQDVNATAMLRAACSAPLRPSDRSGNLRVAVSDHLSADQLPSSGLAVVVGVVDGQTPQVADTMRATATALGVSSGAATAEQLARVTANAAADGREIAGVLVADPDPADHTTGRLPELARPAHRKAPSRNSSRYTETRW